MSEAMIALTRAVPPTLSSCELTHLSREPIDIARASAQHDLYEVALAALGCQVERLRATPNLPDSIFVEDTAIVLTELAIMTRPGAESRRAETESVAEALRQYRELSFIGAPGTIDGGDVLVLGQDIYVGLSSRTNLEGIRQLEKFSSPSGYRTHVVEITGCLHLKSAVTEVGDDVVLLNPSWIDPELINTRDIIEVHPDEPFAANALRLGDCVIYPAQHPRTRQRLEERGIVVRPVEVDELAKAEGGVSCCSILIRL